MEFRHSDRALHWQERVGRFLDDHVLLREEEYRAQVREDHTRQPPTAIVAFVAGMTLHVAPFHLIRMQLV